MKDGKASMSRRTKVVFAVVAVAIMIVAVLPLFLTSSSATPESYQQQIIYDSNNNSGEKRTIIYDGIASSEYNPEYWEGTGYVPSPRNDLYVREVNPETGNLTGNYIKLDDGDKIVTNKSVFVYDGVNYTLYDPSIHATTYNWTGPSVSISGLTMHVTVNAGVTGNIELPSDLTVTAIDNATKSGLSFSDNIISFTRNDGVEFDLTVTLTTNKVFGGWNTMAGGTGDKYLPGETLLTSVTSLYAQWITPDVFTNYSVTIASTDASNVYCKPYFVPATTGNSDKTIDFSNKSDYIQTRGDNRTYDSMYGIIYKLDRSLGNNKGQIIFDNDSLAGTYRSLDLSSKAVVLAGNSGFTVNGDTIFDNVGISSPGNQGKHGGSTKGAIIAEGHILIMGTGIVNETLTEASTPQMSSYNNNNGGLGAPELFGGFASGTNTDTLVDHSPNVGNYTEIISDGVNKGKKTMVFADGTTGDYKISTCLIVHSGVYHTVNGGGLGTIGSKNGAHLSTYASLRGGTSADAAYGGGNYNNGNLYGDDDTMSYSEDDYRKGGSFLYLTGHFFMAGDDWQDKMTGIYYSVYKRDCYKVWESSVATAATHAATLNGSSHLFISGNASVWVANGASREEKGYTSCTMVDLSGSAVVRHVLAGATANANTSGDKSCFKSTWVFVRDNATVAMALGGGYDIYFDPTNSTMKDGGTVNVVISGGTVGNVYGGGYRGSLGASGSTKVTVNVTVTGGTIEGNVYGGGSGGLDRAQHNLDGFKARDNNNTNSVGVSIIYGNVNVNVTGGTIGGNVYGGGMSVPAMYEYNSYTDAGVQKDHFTFANPSTTVFVAAVYGKTNVNISGGEIGGSVYGGGEGLSVEKSGIDNAVVSGDYSRVRVIKCFGGELSIDTIPWYKNGVYNYRTTNMYTLFKNYAKVDADINGDGTADSNATVVKISGDAFIGGGVFGGGNNGCVNGGRILGVDCSGQTDGKEYNVYNSVYGGSSTGDDSGNSTVAITNGKIRNSVFGGGFMGTTDGTTNVAVGYRINPQETIDQIEETSIYIGDSVYAGADVKPGSGTPYSQALVLGDGFVYVYGRNSNITILGSIMGDGNSCLTKGWKEIQIEYFISSNQLTGIHRANKVSLTSSNIKISGREARIFDKVPMYALYYSEDPNDRITSENITDHLNSLYYRSDGSSEFIPFTIDDNTFYTWNRNGYDYNTSSDTKTDYTMLDKNAADFYDTLAACDDLYIGDTTGSNQLIKMASLFRIGKVTLQNGSYITIDKPAEDVRAYESLDSRGNATSNIMPMNQIEFSTGGSFYVRKEMSAEISNYGTVTGYTQLVVSEQGSYGAYVFGSTASTGGFVISKNGQYVYTNISDFTGGIRSWYIAGTEHKLITMSLPTDGTGNDINTVTSTIDLTILQENSNLRYTGGEYVPAHSGFEFINPNNLGNDGKYSLEFAYPDSLTNIGPFVAQGDSLKIRTGEGQYDTISAVYLTQWSHQNITSATYDPSKTIYIQTNEGYMPVSIYDGSSIVTNVTWANITDGNHYAVTMDEGRYILGGTYYGDGTIPSNPKVLSKTDSDNGVYTFNVKFRGKSTQSTDYLGFIILDLEEYTVIQSGNEEFTMVVNTVEIRIDLYVEGYDDGKDIKYDLTLNAVYDDDGYSKGSADVLIQQSHSNYSVYVDKMTAYLYATPAQIDGNVKKYVHSEEFRTATAEQIAGGAYLYVKVNEEYIPATPAQIADGNVLKYTTIFVEATQGEIADGSEKKYVLSGDAPNLTISGIGNVNNTNGWLEAYSREIRTGNNLNSKIGVLTGGYYATTRTAISSIETPEGLSYVVISSVRDTSNQTVNTIIFDISVSWRSYVTVTFHDERYDEAAEGEISNAKILYVNDGTWRAANTEEILAGTGLYVNDGTWRAANTEEIKGALFVRSNATYVPATAEQKGDDQVTKYIHKDGVTVKQFRYNYVMIPADCPSTTSNFSGWYYKNGAGDFTNIYNFNSVLTENIDLYARHMIRVIYNYNNGVVTSVLLNEEEGGTSVPIPSEIPVRKGYTFGGWFTDPGCQHAWDDTKISTELTLYAGWNGKDVQLYFDGSYDGHAIAYGSSLGDILSTKAQGIVNFQYWTVNGIPVYYHTVIDENFIEYPVGILHIDLVSYCVAPAADDLHIRTMNDDSAQGYEGPANANVSVERYASSSWIADLYQSNGGSYTGYYVIGNRDTVKWNTVTGFKAMYDSDKEMLVRNGDAYLNDGQSITVLDVTTTSTLRINGNGAYYYNNNDHIYEPVTSAMFDDQSGPSDLLVNLYENDHGNYKKVTLVKAGNEYTIYKYSFSNRATSTGYTFAGWHYGANDEVSDTHDLAVWIKGDGKVYKIFDLSYESNPIIEWQSGEEFRNICLQYKASWQQMEFTVRTSNNAHGYITVWLEKLYVLDGGNYREATVAEINDDHVNKYIFNGPSPVEVTDPKYLTPLGDQFTVKYNGRVYIKFEGTDNYEIFQKWITIGGCTIDYVTEPGTYMTVTGDCGFTATMTLNEQIIRINITYGASSRDLTESLNIYLVSGGEYIPLKTYDEYRNRYIGFAGNGQYGVCIYANGSYYCIANIELTESRTEPISIDEVELIYITKELIHPVNNMYDIVQASEQYPQENDEYTISGESGEIEAYLFIIGGYGYTQTGDELVIDSVTGQIELGVGHSRTVIYIDDFDFYVDEQHRDHVQKIILIDIEKKKIYIIAKSDWIRQGDTWVPWDNENVGYVVYNMTEEELAHLTITWTDFSEFDTGTPGITHNTISYVWDDDSMTAKYSVIVVDGNVIVYKTTSSTVSVDVIKPLNRNMAIEPQQIIKRSLTIDDISEMAKAESAGNIMAVIGHTMGRRA